MTERAWRAARHHRRSARVGLAVAVVLVLDQCVRLAGQQATCLAARPCGATRHDPVPAQATAYWLTPAPASALTPVLRDFARAALLVDDGGDTSSAGVLLAAPALDASPLGNHVRYYRGLVALARAASTTRPRIFAAVAASVDRSYVVEQSLVRLAEVHEQRGQYALAAEAYARVLKSKPADEDRLTHRWGVALERAGDVAASVAAHRRVYYDFPLSPDADESGDVLGPPGRAVAAARERRGQRAGSGRGAVRRAPLGARRARPTCACRPACRPVPIANRPPCAWPPPTCSSSSTARPWIACVRSPPPARTRPRRTCTWPPALRGLGRCRRLRAGRARARHRVSAERLRRGSAERTGHVVRAARRRCQTAADVFAQMVRQFPGGRFAERAAWKAGWWAYRHDDLAAAVTHFETGAANFPRSDFRPPWLYWSARAKERLGDSAGATARLVLTATDYHNSYYGRLALARLGEGQAVPPSVTESPATRTTPLPTERQIGLLLVARSPRPGAERDAVCASRVGRLAGAHGHGGAGAVSGRTACARASTP